MEHSPRYYVTKKSLCKFEKIKIISSIFSNHNALRLEINYNLKIAKSTNVEAKQYVTNEWITEEIQK